jgi:hypothetical protein
MKIVIFTRTGFHHTSFINRLQEDFEITCVVREAYPEALRCDGPRNGKDARFLEEFHEEYSAGFRYHRMLKDFLKAPCDIIIERPSTKYLNVRCGEINTEGFTSFLNELGPDIIAVLGSSVISPKIISVPEFGAINLHSGLSPYYRGTWSYGWPIVNKEPEYIGATVHYVDPGIDTGDIIHQTRPRLDEADDLNAIFLKVIAEGIELVAQTLEEIAKGAIASWKQPKGLGRLYLSKDFDADAARLCLALLDAGVVGKYNADKETADARVLLHGFVPPRLFR